MNQIVKRLVCLAVAGIVSTFAAKAQTPPDLTITKDDQPDPVPPGDTLDYILSVNNGGQSTASEVEVVDTLPAGVNFGSAAGSGWTCVETTADTTITCTRSSLAGDTTAPNIVIRVTAPESETTLINQVVVSTVSEESNTGNNSDSETTTVTNCPGLLLQDHTVTETEVEEACGAIITGPNYWVAQTGDLTLRSETAIVLRDGFAVELGGKLTLDIDVVTP